MEEFDIYIPIDRRLALAHNEQLADRTQGAALFVDISGFTPLTEALVVELGPQRGAEELTRHINRVYDGLIAELHRQRGSVIGFSGDAITCWFEGDDGRQAVACSLAMQAQMSGLSEVRLPSGRVLPLAVKAVVAAGSARRFSVGDPNIQVIDVLAGSILDRLAAAEHRAQKGEVVLDPATAQALAPYVKIESWREGHFGEGRLGLVGALKASVQTSAWPQLPAAGLAEQKSRPWLLPAVFERLQHGGGEFLAELRPAVALFLRFSGIDYEGDQEAGTKLDSLMRQIQRVLSRYDGTLIQLTIGDKGSYLYAAFGAPTAHEDDDERAINAALELRQAALGLGFVKTVSLGVTRGLMRTGAYGGTQRRTYGVLGDAVNLAARLMQAANPDEILVSSSVCKETGDTFVWGDKHTLQVKGKQEPVDVFPLLQVKAKRAIHLEEPVYHIPMVGRQEELNLIRGKISQVLESKGQIIGITGEAGLGKSRLVAEVIGAATRHGLMGYGSECQSYGTKTSYLVWQGIFQAFFNLDSSWSEDKKISQVSDHLEKINPTLVSRLPLLGTVLNLSIPDSDLTRSFDAKLRKSSLEALLVDCLRAEAQQRSLLIVLENCHWIDPLSEDLLEVIGRAIIDLPVLLVTVYRPPETDEEGLSVSALNHFSEVRLQEFKPVEAERLIRLKLESIFDESDSPSPRLITHLTERAEGNPFYIEELLNYIHDKGLDLKNESVLETLELPSSLQSLILSRIDQLTESQKVTVKLASIIGRLFAAAWLWGAFSKIGEEQRIKGDLKVLSQLEITTLDKPEPELTYLFKHIVTQEVAYESLPYRTRALFHDQLAGFIESEIADQSDRFIYLLAFHYEQTENQAKKKEYLLKAGQTAQANYANSAAIEYYRKVLKLLPEEEQLPVMLKLGQVLGLVGRWQETEEIYQRILGMADEAGDRESRAWCQAALADLKGKQGKYEEAALWLERARETFETLGDQAGVAQTLHSAGTLEAQQGHYEESKRLYRHSLDIRRRLGNSRDISNTLNNLAIIARYQQNFETSRTLHEEALAIRRELGDRSAIAVSLNNLGNLAFDQNNYTEAQARLEEAVALQREVGDRYYLANALNNLGNVARTSRDFERARQLYTESLRTNQEMGALWAIAYLLEDISCLEAAQGAYERALCLQGAAEDLRQEIGAPMSPSEQARLEDSLKIARERLSPEKRVSARQTGKGMTLDEAIRYALENPHKSTTT
jgi:adenylate cyclase